MYRGSVTLYLAFCYHNNPSYLKARKNRLTYRPISQPSFLALIISKQRGKVSSSAIIMMANVLEWSGFLLRARNE